MSDRMKTTVVLGHISRAHGIRGEVVIKSYTENPVDIGAYGPLQESDGIRQFELSHLRLAGKGVIARIAGITNRNAAEALRGVQLCIERNKLPAPEPDEFYHADLIGLTARRKDGSVVGQIVAVQNFGAGDLLEIQLAGKKRTEFVPFNQDFVPDLDVMSGHIVVTMPDDIADNDKHDNEDGL